MAEFIPTSQIDSLFRSPKRTCPRVVLNSGYLLTYADLVKYQKLLADTLRRHSRDYMKWPGISKAEYLSLYVTENIKSFDLLSHSGNISQDTFIINAGSAYTAQGMRLYASERTSVSLSFPGAATEAYLCLRLANEGFTSIDFIEHPLFGNPVASKIISSLEWFLTESIYEAATVVIDVNGTLTPFPLYYPEVNSCDAIDGIVLAKVTKQALAVPDITYKTMLLGVKNTEPLDLPGFIDITPSA